MRIADYVTVDQYHVCYIVSRASPSYSKRERGSGERSYTRLSPWNAITMTECDVFGHKVHIYVARFVHNSQVDIACMSLPLRLCMIHAHRDENRNS